MFPSNAHTIRYATDADADALRRLAALNDRPGLTGRVLIAQDDGVTVAALSVDDGGTVADPADDTQLAAILLRLRAAALTAFERMPSLRERVLAGTRVGRSAAAHGAA